MIDNPEPAVPNPEPRTPNPESGTPNPASHLDRLVAENEALHGGPVSPIRQVGIIGAGLMGTAIAALNVRAGLQVVLLEQDPAALSAAGRRIAEAFHADPQEAELLEQAQRLVRVTADGSSLSGCELVLESIVEQLGPKLDLLRQLAPHVAQAAVVASNTSTIPIGKLAAAIGRPERFCGIHFFHPVAQRRLVEIIAGPLSSAATIAAAAAYAKRLGKLSIAVGDGPGFVVNRLVLSWINEALQMLLEGVESARIEQAATGFGMAKGPLELLDEIGLDTALRGGLVVYQAFPDRVLASPLLVGMVKAGWLGRKSGVGFYRYSELPGGQFQRQANADLGRLVDKWRTPPPAGGGVELALRLVLPMLLEAVRILEEGEARGPGDVDLGAVFGLGFPRHEGGLFCWADRLGARRLVELVKPLEPLGPRMQPPSFLLELARGGGRFYNWST